MRVKAIIASRSILASNVYRLLLTPCNPEIIFARKFEMARPWFFRREKINLAIFHSDIFLPKFDYYYKKIKEDGPFDDVWKIFVCKTSPSEKDWQKKLKSLPKSYVVERPFDIKSFNDIVSEVLNAG